MGFLVRISLLLCAGAIAISFLSSPKDPIAYPEDTIGVTENLLLGYVNLFRNRASLKEYTSNELYGKGFPLKGKKVLITGGTRGLGKGITAHFAALGADLILPCRKVPDRVEEVIKSDAKAVRKEWTGKTNLQMGKITTVLMDLADLESVDACIQELKKGGKNYIDIVVNNAGLQAPYIGYTKQGFEMTFGVNYLGVAHFTLELLNQQLLSTATRPRIMSVTSEEHRSGKRLNASGLVPFGKPWGEGLSDAMERYGYSKLAMTTFFLHLGKLHPEVDVYDICPGPVASEIARGLGFLSTVIMTVMKWTFPEPTQAALPLLRLLTSPEYENVQPQHYHMAELKPARSDATDELVASTLFSDTQKLLNARQPPPLE